MTLATAVLIAAALCCIVVAPPLFLLWYTGRSLSQSMQDQTAAQLELFSQYQGAPAGTDPALIERVEACERRVAAAASDLEKFYRKTAQERRRIETATGEEVDDDQLSLTPADLRASLAPQAPTPNGRRLLRPRGHSRR